MKTISFLVTTKQQQQQQQQQQKQLQDQKSKHEGFSVFPLQRYINIELIFFQRDG